MVFILSRQITGEFTFHITGHFYFTWQSEFPRRWLVMLRLHHERVSTWFMMASSNGNIFRVTGHLCGEFTGPRWIPHTKASDAELWCFLWSASEKNSWVNNREAGDLRSYRAHYDVTVMVTNTSMAEQNGRNLENVSNMFYLNKNIWILIEIWNLFYNGVICNIWALVHALAWCRACHKPYYLN